eukprot:Gb_20580 [translate_table: standard]
MEINSRRPSWRCPYCNRHVSCPDLRLDQNMVKVLNEVGEDVADVLISGDGSWKVMPASDNMKDQLQDNNCMDRTDALLNRYSEGTTSLATNIIDLTTDNDERHSGIIDLGGHSNGSQGTINIPNMWRKCRDSSDTEDRKPDSETLRRISIADALPNAPLSNPITQISSRANSQIVTDAWARDRFQVSISSGASVISMPRREHFRTGVSESLSSSNSFAPVLTDAVTPALNRAPVEARDLTQTGNPLQSMSLTRHFLPAENRDLHLTHSMHGTSISSIGMEAERHSNRLVSRAPIAIQALPAQTQVANSFTRSRMSALRSNSTTQVGGSSNGIQNIAPLASLSDSFETTFHADQDRQHGISRQQQTLQAMLDLPTSSPVQFQAQLQNRELQDRQHRLVQSIQPAMAMQTPTQSVGRINVDQQRISTGRNSFQLSQEQQSQQQNLINQWLQQTSVPHDPLLRHPQRVPHPFQQVAHSGLGSSPSVSDTSSFPSMPVLNQHPHTTQRAVPSARPPSVQFSRSISTGSLAFQRSNTAHNSDPSRLTVADQRWSSSTTAPVMSRAEGSQEVGIEHTWRPTGRMRGSIVGSGRVGNSSTNPFFNQQVTSGHTRPPFIGSSQSAGPAGSLGPASSNAIQRPLLNTWNSDSLNTGSLWNPIDGTSLRPSGSTMGTQMQGSDQNNNPQFIAGSDLEMLGLLSDFPMPPNDASQMLG